MPSLNRVTLMGNLGQDPELKYLQDGTPVANFSIAVNEKWRDRSGQTQERVNWFRIVVWRKLADICAEYLRKGSPVYVEGKLVNREWEKDGDRRFSIEVVAREIQFLSTRGEGEETNYNQSSEEDIPF